MKLSLKTFLVLLLFFAGLVACEKDKGPVIIKPGGADQEGDTLVSFVDDIQPVFNNHCITCHNQSHPFLDLREGYSYNQLLHAGHSAPYVIVSDPSQSLIIERLLGVEFPIMPPNQPPLNQGTIDTIMTWIRQGAMDN